MILTNMKTAIRTIRVYCAKRDCRDCKYDKGFYECLFKNTTPCDWEDAIKEMQERREQNDEHTD